MASKTIVLSGQRLQPVGSFGTRVMVMLAPTDPCALLLATLSKSLPLRRKIRRSRGIRPDSTIREKMSIVRSNGVSANDVSRGGCSVAVLTSLSFRSTGERPAHPRAKLERRMSTPLSSRA